MPTETPAPVALSQVRYAIGGRTILDGIDLTVRQGEIFAVMGRSGTGKTTLLRLIIGLIKPDGGTIRVNGVDIGQVRERRLDQIRESMGFVFQGSALLDSLTVAGNVALPLVEHRRATREELAGRVRALLEMVDVAGAEQLLPAELSGGMRKRVGIARALAMDPSIVLYDEPTAGLDPISATAITELIRTLRARTGVTSIIVSHDVASLRRIADRAALLHDGRFLALGTMEEIAGTSDPAVQQFLAGRPEGPMTDTQGAGGEGY
jgi:phospholipid/cholesterol/gamma-HCH transport system ATP-binding protein